MTQKGFSLIELLVVVAIVGILASIALPAYTDYATKGKIPDGINTLSSAQVRLEQYFQDNQKYTGGPCPARTTYFSYECTLGDSTFLITATGDNGMDSFNYTINESGTKTSSTTWGSSSSCWVTKKGGAC